MTVRVCSGFSPSGRVIYGERFLETFDRNWPAEVELQVYVEEMFDAPRGACRDLWSIPGARECAEVYAAPIFSGAEPTERWKPKERMKGYSFRFDAGKFWKQILIPQTAAQDMANGDALVWLDGDVETLAPVPGGLIDELLGDADVCYLGREPKHSEIGFWAVRLNDKTRKFLAEIAAMYSSRWVVDLKEWHSAFVWDTVRKRSDLSERNLCAPGARGSVFPQSPLRRYLRHDKGKRKPGGVIG
jgi:hypothetical protein